MSNILITGHRGFVGSHVFEAFQQEQLHSIYGFDLPDYDFTTEKDVECIIKNNKIDIIIHIGAMAGLKACYDDPTEASRINVFGTATLLKIAKKYNCKFLHTSTWAVNGKLEHPYDISKKAAEDLVLMYNNLYDLDTMILRLATMYGYGMRENGVIYNFIKKSINNETIVIQGDGQQYRQFLYIDDATEAYIKAIENWRTGTIYEIQSDEKVSILDIAKAVYPDMNNIEFAPKRAGDESSFFVDNSLAKKELNWEPRISLKEGMERLKNWIEKH